MTIITKSLKKKHTADGNPVTFLGFIGRVGAHTVVISSVLSSDIADPVGRFQFPGDLKIESALCLLVPGEVDGKGATLNGALKSHLLPLRDVPHARQHAQHWS